VTLTLTFCLFRLAFWTWTAPCVVCGSLRRGTNGLFCANFGLQWGPPFDVCRRAWCGPCYTQHPQDPFRVFIPTDSLALSGGAIHPRPCGTSWHGMVTTLSPRFSAISACSGCSLGGSRMPPIIKMIGFFAVSCGLTWTPFGGVRCQP
jgi:hypothetical protein